MKRERGERDNLFLDAETAPATVSGEFVALIPLVIPTFKGGATGKVAANV